MKFAPKSHKLATMETAYQAAHTSGIIVDRSSLGYLRFSGQTRLDLINRMSTQKVDGLMSGGGAATVLTTDIGRVVDRIILYADDEVVFCLTGDGNGDSAARYLTRFVFFMDDFHVDDLTAQTAVLALYGAGVTEALQPYLEEVPSLPLHHWRKADISGAAVSIHRTDPVAGDGYLLLCRSEDVDQVRNALQSTGLVLVGAEAFEYLRIESGLPLFGHELTQEYIPLEAGLRPDISFNKGCYIGQEIIARMDSRGKLAKQLVKLRPESPIDPGTEITAQGRTAGIVTSAANGPHGPVALGYVKSTVLEAGISLVAGPDSVPISVLSDIS